MQTTRFKVPSMVDVDPKMEGSDESGARFAARKASGLFFGSKKDGMMPAVISLVCWIPFNDK